MKNYIILVDVSYSMHNYIDKIVDSLNNFIQKLRFDGEEVYITISYFNNTMCYIQKLTPLSHTDYFSPKSFNIFGSTALYDAIGEILSDTNFRPFHNEFYIISDGDDTCSHLFKKDQIDNLCSEAQASGFWNIVYMHTDLCQDMLTTKNVVYDLDDDLSNLMNDLSI